MKSHPLLSVANRSLLAGMVLLVLGTFPAGASEPVTVAAITPQTTLPPVLENWTAQLVDAVLAKADPARFKTIAHDQAEALLPQLRVDSDNQVVRMPFYSIDHQKQCLAKLRAAGVGRVLSGELVPMVYDYLLMLRLQDVGGGGVQQYAVFINDPVPHLSKDLTDKLVDRFADRLGLKPGAVPKPNAVKMTLPAQFKAVPGAALDAASGLPMEVENTLDGSHLVLIPAGDFQMGWRDEEISATDVRDCTPAHLVWLPPVYIGKFEVSNRQYDRFIKEKSHRSRKGDGQNEWDKAESRVGAPEQPASFVSFNDALAYVQWAKLVLPTEEMWEKSARGPKTLSYPWGDLQPNVRLCDFGQNPDSGKPVNVDALPKGVSGYGCFNMAGGVTEWCDSWYRPYPGFKALYPLLSSTAGNVGVLRKNGDNVYPTNGRISRGGSWLTTRNNDLCSWRRSALFDVNDILRSLETGFRVAFILPLPD